MPNLKNREKNGEDEAYRMVMLASEENDTSTTEPEPEIMSRRIMYGNSNRVKRVK